MLKVAPYSKLAVRSVSTSMARALKSARRPRKNQNKHGLSGSKYSTQKNFINFLLKLIVQKVWLV